MVTPAQRRAFQEDGFVKFENVFSAVEVATLREALCAEIAAYEAGRRADDPRYLFARSSDHLLEIANLFNIVPGFTDLSVHRRLAVIAAGLLDVTALRVYQDALLYKTKAHGDVTWHQDDYFSVLDGKGISIWMPLSSVGEQDGSLLYAKRSSHDGLVDREAIGSDADVDAYLRQRGYEIVATALRAGDVLFHSNRVFHRSNPNRTDVPRVAFSLFLFEDGARIRPPEFGRSALTDMVHFPGRDVGDLADTDLNPIVYSERGSTIS
jgi:ectoine hydroxylase-related dioxygenase (phytanoyl-CoA dioxygenase family)